MEQVQCTEQIISEEWISEKYNQYKTLLYRISFSYVGSRQDCEDILQEAFIRLCYKAPAFPSLEDEKRWIIRITINLCKSHLRSFWNRKKVNIDELEEIPYEQEEKEALTELVRLPEKYKTVIVLYYIGGYKINEISALLQLGTSAVKMRLKRGREQLKLEMEEAK